MKDIITTVSKDELRHIAIVGTHLHRWQGKGKLGIKKVIKEHGLVQLDPLNPAGRYHDLFFLARVPDYNIGDFEKIVYPEKLIFEAFSPNLSAISVEHFPIYYSRMDKKNLHQYYQFNLKKFEKVNPDLLDNLLQVVKEKGLIKSSDLAHLGKADPSYASWKSSRLSGTGLEFLWLLGKLVVAQRNDQFHKSYDIIENYIPKRYLNKKIITENEFLYQRFIIQQKSYPLIALGNVNYSKTKLKIGKTKQFNPEWFMTQDEYGPKILQLEGSKKGISVPYYWKKLLDEDIDNECRALGPLDPLIWDRDLTKLVFDYDYTWEVYKKKKDRKWGYYVYPLLYNQDLIGRLEAKMDKKSNILTFFNFQLEGSTEVDNKMENAFITMFKRWESAIGAVKVEFDESVSAIITIS
ncbi:MAG: DNA glycosylase AlkZ-like family protein [Candidatus Hodarchaeales archaeon]|jgi:uncharacterized protein YcaQ